jgi:hypothetical protein
MARRSSLLLRLAGLVLVACAITVAACLLLAWRTPEGAALTALGPRTVAGEDQPRWVIESAEAFGATALRRHVAPADWPASATQGTPPFWSGARRAPTASDVQLQQQTQGDRMITEVAYGWPFRAMKYRYTWTTHPVGFSGRLYYFDVMERGIQLGNPGRGVGSALWYPQLKALPLQPIPAGFAGNVLILFLAMAAPPRLVTFVRRRRRRKRGLCGACGYDLRGHSGPAVCPECGSQEPGRSS